MNIHFLSFNEDIPHGPSIMRNEKGNTVNSVISLFYCILFILIKSIIMEFQKLGDSIYIPEIKGSPLADKKHIEYNYYLSTKINGNKVDLDLTTKLFDKKAEYICKSCYRIPLDQIENCVKANLVNHMCVLGMKRNNIPESLLK